MPLEKRNLNLTPYITKDILKLLPFYNQISIKFEENKNRIEIIVHGRGLQLWITIYMHSIVTKFSYKTLTIFIRLVLNENGSPIESDGLQSI
jgi:hypothetical protein